MQIKAIFLSLIISLFFIPFLMPAQAAGQDAKTYVFECNNSQDFVFDINRDGAWLFLKDQTIQLQAPEGLLAYNAPGIELLIHNDSAILRQPGEVTLLCENNPEGAVWEHAKLNGVDFRAVGNAPEWTLEFIAGKRLVFVNKDSGKRVETSRPEPVSDTRNKTTRWDADEISIEASAVPCQDSISAETFESSVIVYLDDLELRGCGRALH